MAKKNNPQAPFPSDFVPQAAKKKASWILQACKAAHSYSTMDFLGSLDTERRKYVKLRKYAQGGYDNEKFKNVISGRGNTVTAALNLEISTPLPTIKENLVGLFENQGLKPKVKCLSPESKTQYDKKLRELKADRFLKLQAPQLKKVGVDIESKLSGKVIFEDEEEIELYMDTDFKDDYSFAMQTAIDYIFESQDLPYLKRKLYEDLVVCGKASLKIYFDENYDIRIRHVDPVKLITSWVDKDNFTDARYQGEFVEMDINELSALAGEDISEEELMKIARSQAGRNGNGDWVNEWGTRYYPSSFSDVRPYGHFKVTVLDIEYKSNDRVPYEKKPAKGGGFYFERVKGKSKGEIEEKIITNIYKGKWIVGTETVFDYGLKENMTRDLINGNYSADTDFSYITFAPDLRDMRNTSMIERLVGLADAYILANLRAQIIIAKARPQGIKLDVAMLGAITNALGEKNIKTRDLVDLMEQSSTYYYSSMTENGQMLPNTTPIAEVPESPMIGLQTLAAHEQGILRAMEFATGVPLSTIGAPPKETLVGIQKAAAENRNNAIRYINNAYKSILSRSCKIITLMVQDSIGGKAKKIDDYRMSIGSMNTEVLDFTKKLTGVQFGIFVDVLPDAVEQQEFIDALSTAVNSGQITQSQKMRLARIGKEQPELAERMMEMFEKKNAQRKLQEDTTRIQAQSQSNAQAALTQAKGDIAKLTHEYQLKAQYEMVKAKAESGLSAQESLQKLKEIALEGEQKIEQILTAIMGQDMSEEGGESATSNYDRVDMPKSSGVRMPSLGANANNQKPNI